MAITVTDLKKQVVGDEREHSGSLDVGTYAAGGVSFTPATFGLNKLRHLEVQAVGWTGAAVRLVALEFAASKLRVWDAATPTEIGAVDLSAMKLRFMARGSI
jgi:hypothetical protein